MLSSTERTETIECDCYSDLFQRAPKHVRETLGLEVYEWDDGIAFSARGDRSLILNRALTRPSTKDGARWLEESLRYFARRGITNYLLQLAPRLETPALQEELTRRGLEPFRRAWVKFVRGNEPAPERVAPFSIEPATAETAADLGRIVARNFGLTESSGALYEAAMARPGWHGWVARRDGRCVAAGALYIQGDVGYLAAGATEPEFRGQGAQGALMALRVRRAIELGCRWLVTETGAAVPGEPNSSYNNMLRCGFQAVYARPNYCPKAREHDGWEYSTEEATRRS